MKAFVNYALLLGIGSVLSLPTMPLQFAPNIAPSQKPVAPATASGIAVPSGAKPYSFRIEPNAPMAKYSAPDMVHLPQCQMLDEFKNGQVYAANGQLAGQSNTYTMVPLKSGGYTLVRTPSTTARPTLLPVGVSCSAGAK